MRLEIDLITDVSRLAVTSGNNNKHKFGGYHGLTKTLVILF